ncbi:MAG: 5'-methylthioadenosine/S-adenosylhomocysteine nucleosidase [Leptolyngbyaceae cyanobacterium RU_5_1]|nr:5'-methylthioadenosine/S-adenosylhomocysteine nucleosidase [Leptolyngbyaceae cyanobacterium RU_5_1]
MRAEEIKGKVDFGIITIRQDEFQAILERFPPSQSVKGERCYYSVASVLKQDSEPYLVASSRCLEQGNQAARSLADQMIKDLAPQWLIVVGIAGGIPDSEYTLGDVVVATRIYDFCVGAEVEGRPTQFSMRGGSLHGDVEGFVAYLPALESALQGWNTEKSISLSKPPVELSSGNFKSIDDSWNDKVCEAMSKHFGTSSLPRFPKFITAPIASSDRLIKNSEIVQIWLQTSRSARAIEMESAGIYEAARQYNPAYPFFAIRGISDVVGFKRDDAWTTYACHSAAAFTHALISRTVPFEPRAVSSTGIGSVQRLETKILIVLYNHYRENPGQPEMGINALIRASQSAANDVMDCLSKLQENALVKGTFTAEGNMGFCKLTDRGRRSVQDSLAHRE